MSEQTKIQGIAIAFPENERGFGRNGVLVMPCDWKTGAPGLETADCRVVV